MFKTVSFNLRLDCGADGQNNFEFRKPLIKKKIETEKPDIIGFQEVLPTQALWLKKALPAYTFLGCGRNEDYTGEQMTVAVKKERFDIIKMDTFWLSPQPDHPGSRFEHQSMCPRCASDVILRDLLEKKTLRIVNTHLDHESEEARRLGLSVVLQYLDADIRERSLPTLLCGDFNAPPGAPELSALMSREDFIEATASLSASFHAYGRIDNPEKIDYIFFRGSLHLNESGAWEDRENGVYLSDHYPVWADLEFLT